MPNPLLASKWIHLVDPLLALWGKKMRKNQRSTRCITETFPRIEFSKTNYSKVITTKMFAQEIYKGTKSAIMIYSTEEWNDQGQENIALERIVSLSYVWSITFFVSELLWLDYDEFILPTNSYQQVPHWSPALAQNLLTSVFDWD